MPAAGRSLPMRAEVLRKGIHLATAALPVAWATTLLSASSIRLVLGCAVLVALSVEFARFRGGAFAAAFGRILGPLLRPHESGAVSGATWLAIGMWGVAMLAPTAAAIAALWAAAVGDACAALAGRAVQRWRATPARGKTLVGAVAGATATAVGVYWLTPASAGTALLLGAAAAAAEWPARPGDDNLRVVAAVAIAATLVGLR